MFIDHVIIEAAAGDGGDGCVAFRREKYVPKGGPDGGDGGHGGNVVFEATDRVNSLLGVGRKPRYVAPNGRPGGPRKRAGHWGEDLVVEVPIGTQVIHAERGHLLRDLCAEGDRLVIAKGGKGGHGNAHFTTAIRQAPRQADKGEPGERRRVKARREPDADRPGRPAGHLRQGGSRLPNWTIRRACHQAVIAHLDNRLTH